ncbi:MAG: nucleoside 2-deoxyribosyltransferase, partial [Gemmataceae bacterium]|nr:nucleoside 2-deoxyribosyltransferase [Gemmataceae bacterium]
MPFAPEFEDVYATIQTAVEGARRDNPLLCFRLDQSRPAGRITTRLVQEIQSASLCIADLTGNRPNIMWEVGYAMALGKPTILITQDTSDLPFDIHDMETLRYSRDRLNASLGQPLRRMVIDTVSSVVARTTAEDGCGPGRGDLIGELLAQVRELREIIGQSVKNWAPGTTSQRAPSPPRDDPSGIEGAWVNEESNTHLYARVVEGELVAPYCYAGNDRLVIPNGVVSLHYLRNPLLREGIRCLVRRCRSSATGRRTKFGPNTARVGTRSRNPGGTPSGCFHAPTNPARPGQR